MKVTNTLCKFYHKNYKNILLRQKFESSTYESISNFLEKNLLVEIHQKRLL